MRNESRPRPDLSVVIPAFNESGRLPRTLPATLEYLVGQPYTTEIVVVDDGSRDDTASLARCMLSEGRGRVVSLPRNRGKGYAFRRGFLETHGTWVLLSDADFSTPIHAVESLRAIGTREHADLVIGSRRLDPRRVERRQGRLRRITGAGYRAVASAVAGVPFQDTQCGFKLMQRSTVLPVVERMRIDGFAFDVELLFLALRFGLRVVEAAVPWRNDTSSKVRLLVDPLRMAWDTLAIRRLHRDDAVPVRGRWAADSESA